MTGTAHERFTAHQNTIREALSAIRTRTFYAHWNEVPSGKIYGETAMTDGETAFHALLGKRFPGTAQPEDDLWFGAEESPYGLALGVSYPVISSTELVRRAKQAFRPWARLSPDERAGILVEALERSASGFYALAFATMHTTGQGFVMAFQASGPHAYDRALEAVALGWQEQTRFPEHVLWEKPMGKMTVKLEKSFRSIGRGVALAIGCSTFPVWNTLPSVFGSLVTGNSVIVKPHPKAILPIAMVIADVRAVFEEYGIDPDVLQLGIETESPIAKDLAMNPDVKIIDYTGGSAFGSWLESLPDKIVFTEKAGVNSVILDSMENLDHALENIAFSLSLYSGQMCTTPQNIFIPERGVLEGKTSVSYADIVARLKDRIQALAANEKMGPGTLGAIQNGATIQRLDEARGLGFPVALDSAPVAQPGFNAARSISPMLLEVPVQQGDVYRREMFGPVTMIIKTADTAESIARAAAVARDAGAITFAAYTTDDDVMQQIEEELAFAGASISFNLTGPVWVNQSASYSDFHVSGGNPAGNASLVDPSFITRRFYTIGIRKPAV